jgi:hypothetical protein
MPADTRSSFIPVKEDIEGLGDPGENVRLPNDDLGNMHMREYHWDKICKVFHLLPGHIVDDISRK